MKSCAFLTFGCKVNQYDTQAIREACQREGLREAVDGHPAEVYVINTCSVTEDADREALRMIRRIRHRQAEAHIIVTGCLVDRKLKVLNGANLIVPNRQKHLIAGLIVDDQARDTFMPCFDGGYSALSISRFEGHTRAFVKAQDGCNYNCSFCKIPQVRGRSVSRPLPEIVEEAHRLVAHGYRELVLTGVSLGTYGQEWGSRPTLEDVIEALVKIQELWRLRLSSIEPSDVTPRLLELMAKSPVLCRHLHLPLQSGSDRILSLMRRHYSARAYCELVAQAKRNIPGLAVSTDVIAGFPSETEEDFANTKDALKAIWPIRTHLFPYSRRKATFAATLTQQVHPLVVKRRMEELRRSQADLTLRYLKTSVGDELEVLIEQSASLWPGRLEGYSDTYVRCLLEGPSTLINRLIRVRVTEAKEDHVLATLQ